MLQKYPIYIIKSKDILWSWPGI